MKVLLAYLVYAMLTVFSCGKTTSSTTVTATTMPVEPPTQTTASYDFPYYVNAPNDKQELPQVLTEISGLTQDGKGNIYCVQDEQGFIFKLNPTEGIQHYTFRKEGDYEGIELVGDDLYVVNSSGSIFKVTNLGKDNQSTEKFNGFLNSRYDIEGLGYDKKINALLIACKAGGTNETGTRAIFKFDIATKTFDETPYFSLSFRDYWQKLEELAPTNEGAKKLWEKKGKNATFQPSAIAIHPKSDDVYVLSAKSNALLVCDRTGKILHIEKLKKKIHTQAEGITFDEDGTMYISNEGKETPAVIYTYKYGK